MNNTMPKITIDQIIKAVLTVIMIGISLYLIFYLSNSNMEESAKRHDVNNLVSIRATQLMLIIAIIIIIIGGVIAATRKNEEEATRVRVVVVIILLAVILYAIIFLPIDIPPIRP